MATFEASFNSGSEVSALLDTSAPPQKFETLRHQTHGAVVSWVRSVLGPMCKLKAATRTKDFSRQNLPWEMLWFWCLVPKVWRFGTPRPSPKIPYSSTTSQPLPTGRGNEGEWRVREGRPFYAKKPPPVQRSCYATACRLDKINHILSFVPSRLPVVAPQTR